MVSYIIMSHAFNMLLETAQEVASTWPQCHPEINSQDDEHIKYLDASEIFFDEIIAIGESIPDKLQSQSARHGMKILFRTCNLAALLAKQGGLNAHELHNTLINPLSFDGIARMAELPNKVNRRVETQYGLTPYTYPIHESQLEFSSIDENHLTFKDIRHISDVKRREVEGEHGPQRNAVCAAHNSNALSGLFLCAVNVCTTDKNLFQHTLAK